MGRIRKSSHSIFYILHSKTRALYKVGVTNDFDARVATLCAATGEQLEQVIYIKTEIADHVEFLVHGMFVDQWTQHGEWFRLGVDGIRVVHYLIQGLFLNSLARKRWEENPSFAYWENHHFLIAHGVFLESRTLIRMKDGEDRELLLWEYDEDEVRHRAELESIVNQFNRNSTEKKGGTHFRQDEA